MRASADIKSETVLEVRSLSVHAGARPLLSDISLTFARTGLTWLVGPVAAGKSTLLRALAGRLDTLPGFVVGGRGLDDHEVVLAGQRAPTLLVPPVRAVMDGMPNRQSVPQAEARARAIAALVDAGLEPLVGETRPVAELSLGIRRRVAIATAALGTPSLVLIDEPTATLDEDERRDMLAYIEKLSRRTSVLCVTHNRRDIQELGGRVVLLAGGTIQETGDAEGFLVAPASAPGKSYVETGSASVPSLGADPLDLENAPVVAPWVKWVKPDRLAGIPRPGLLRDYEVEIKTLSRLGTTLLVCLEEEAHYDTGLLAPYGIRWVHLPIPDMAAAPPDQLFEVASVIRATLDAGSVAVVHCKAGLGRTGMMLAATFVLEGTPPAEAVAAIRAIQPRFIQTESQVEALFELARHLEGMKSTSAQER